LLAITAPPEPEDYAPVWRRRLARALEIEPRPQRLGSAFEHPDFDVFDIRYRSTDAVDIGGWLLVPRNRDIRRGLVVGHGYGGRDAPDFNSPVDDAAVLFPCLRGLSRSRLPGVPDDPSSHVLYAIDDPERYILRGCVEDVWLGVSALLAWFPHIEGRIGYLGASFGGGVGAMAIGFDQRIARGHLNVPSFGHQPLRLTLPTVGSGEAVRAYAKIHGDVLGTLRYYDAALAARHITRPMHVAAALFDPAVAPPGQFAIHNALAGPKTLFVLDAGHYDYPARDRQGAELATELVRFFEDL
jgi:cephalosporin-C deacetylase